MVEAFGHRQARVAPAQPRTALVPRQRTPAGQPDRAARPTPSPASAPAVVLIADPVQDTRERLAAGLADAGIGRVIQADSADRVDALVADAPGGHLALVSLSFGAAAPRLISALCRVPWTRVIALVPSADAAPLLDAVAAGATGFLRGHPCGSGAPLPPRLGRLTSRELEVLQLVADGRSNKWIAAELSLSALTVKSHLSRISRKLGTGDRSHQVAVAMRAGLLR